MPTYLVQLVTDSSLRLFPTAHINAALTPLTVTLSGNFTITIRDNVVSIGEVNVPRGLVINIEVQAEDFNAGIEHAQQAATYFLSIASCMGNASILQPRPVWAYDATPGLTERQFTAFAYDFNLHLSTRNLKRDHLLDCLGTMFNRFASHAQATADAKARLTRAILSFRRGLADTEDTLDEFLIHWSALETLDVVYRKVFGHEAAYIFKTCGKCKSSFRDCPQCGDPNTFLVSQRHTGIEDVFAALGQSEKYNQLRKLRNGMSHGYMSLSECVDIATANIELVRKAVLSMIMRIIGMGEDVQALVVGQPGIKGKYIPHFRVHAMGSFEPGDPSRYDTHPVVEVQCTGIEAATKDGMVILHPTWVFTNKNCPLTYTGYELWGDEATNLTVTDEGTFVDAAKHDQQSQPSTETENGMAS